MQQANLFELHSATIQITYSSSSFDGKPQLSYQRGSTSMNFRGKQIRHKPTEIGTLISVTLKSVPDLRTIVLSLILPQVNVSDGQSQVRINIKVIETTVRTSIGGPNLVKGQVQTYKVYALQGTAKHVLF
ncbi:MAG: hypothetical protein DYG98_03095 [Haliscomenobacteraceae bacterium CHB4]|nr:hypothetical protein [Saprospiraceae bacterium]MCE7922017.1 hypothetical protein [Haliscomenobacteraceae bacterium CHB4]